MTIRVLIIARRPITLDDFGFESDDEIEVVHFARRLQSLEELADQADVAVIDVDFPEGATYRQITSTTAELPELRVLALTTSPPRHDEVARAIEAGAVGFVDSRCRPRRVQHRCAGSPRGRDCGSRAPQQRPCSETSPPTSRSPQPSADLDWSPSHSAWSPWQARSLRSFRCCGEGTWATSGSVPSTSGSIRPHEWSMRSPPSPILIAAFGPFLYIRGWLDTVESAVSGRDVSLDRRSSNLRRAPSSGWSGSSWRPCSHVWADLVLVLVVGPIVGISLLAFTLDLTSEMPSMLRIDFARPRRAAFTAMAIVFLFIAALSTEVLLRGPEFNEKGAESGFVTAFMGFKAQPVIVTDVDGALPVRQRLYLGGNADLYVLLDPCDGDKIEMVSVGSSRIEVVEDISC